MHHGVCAPRCGDGLLSGDEACDDGNTLDDDACTNRCEVALRDGIVWAGEETCDDQKGDDDDACTQRLRVARCGDGIRRTSPPAPPALRAAMMATSSWVTGAETTAPSSAAAMGSTTHQSNVTTATQSRPMHAQTPVKSLSAVRDPSGGPERPRWALKPAMMGTTWRPTVASKVRAPRCGDGRRDDLGTGSAELCSDEQPCQGGEVC